MSGRSHGSPDLRRALEALHAAGRPENITGRARFGITNASGFGVAVPELRRIARGLRPDHALALQLWRSGSLDARMLAAMIDDPAEVGRAQMDRWARDFDSWAVCDGCCQDLFWRTRAAWPTAFAWTHRREEYVKRAGFAMFAELAVHDAHAPDERFLPALERCLAEARDERKYVRKGVNWALRQIGKRTPRLRGAAIRTARRIHRLGTPTAHWIASDALRELRARARSCRSVATGSAAAPTSRRGRRGSPSRGRPRAARSTPSGRRRRAAAPR